MYCTCARCWTSSARRLPPPSSPDRRAAHRSLDRGASSMLIPLRKQGPRRRAIRPPRRSRDSESYLDPRRRGDGVVILVAPAKAGAQAESHPSTAPFARRHMLPGSPLARGVRCHARRPCESRGQAKSHSSTAPFAGQRVLPGSPPARGWRRHTCRPCESRGPGEEPFGHCAVRSTAHAP